MYHANSLLLDESLELLNDDGSLSLVDSNEIRMVK
jgi:hypothetical protein